MSSWPQIASSGSMLAFAFEEDTQAELDVCRFDSQGCTFRCVMETEEPAEFAGCNIWYCWPALSTGIWMIV